MEQYDNFILQSQKTDEYHTNPPETNSFNNEGYPSGHSPLNQSDLSDLFFDNQDLKNVQTTMTSTQTHSTADSNEGLSNKSTQQEQEQEQENKNKTFLQNLPRTIKDHLLKMLRKEPNSPMKRAFIEYCKRKKNFNQKRLKKLLWGNAWKGKTNNRKEFRKFCIEEYLGGQYFVESVGKNQKEYLFFFPQLMNAAINKNAPKGFDCKVRHQKNQQKQEQHTYSSDISEAGQATRDDTTAANTQNSNISDDQSNQFFQRSSFFNHENYLQQKEINELSIDEKNDDFGFNFLFSLENQEEGQQFNTSHSPKNIKPEKQLEEEQENGQAEGLLLQQRERPQPESQDQNEFKVFKVYNQLQQGQYEYEMLKFPSQIDQIHQEIEEKENTGQQQEVNWFEIISYDSFKQDQENDEVDQYLNNQSFPKQFK